MSLGLGNLALCTVSVMDKSDSVFNFMESISCVFRFACVCVYVPARVLLLQMCWCVCVSCKQKGGITAVSMLMSCQDLCAHGHVRSSYLANWGRMI